MDEGSALPLSAQQVPERRDDDAAGLKFGRRLPPDNWARDLEFRRIAEGLAQTARSQRESGFDLQAHNRAFVAERQAKLAAEPNEPVERVQMSDAEITRLMLASPYSALRKAAEAGRWKRAEPEAGPKRCDDSADGDDKVTPITSKKKRGLVPVDDGIATAFAEEYRGDLRYVASWGKWFEWSKGVWREDETLHVFSLIRRTCKARGIEKASMSRMVGAVHSLVRADPRLAATVEQWDADPWLLNTPDGVVDLRTGAKRAHRPADYMTKATTVGPRGDRPLWEAFLAKIMGGDDALIAYLQRVLGYCLTGDTSEQALFFAHGVGQNGKTVLTSTVSGILGDYCQATPIETFTESRTDRHPTELARMRGARLVTATETEGGKYWAESRLKELTGGERVAARFMHKDFFDYQPQFKPWISGNHKPRLRSVGKAMRRRVNMMPFLITIPDHDRDPKLTEKLKAEWPGILQWMIDGCLDWQEHGLAPPEAVVNATDAYFAGEDGYADWVAERCEIITRHRSRSSDLFASWKDWAEKAGQPHGDTKRFREEMERLGFHYERGKAGSFFVGVRVRQDPPQTKCDRF
jgi:putative DNA primase/helicase